MASGNKTVIAFLSVSTENSTDQLVEQIKLENEDFRCVFVKLTQQDLQSFQPGETYNAVVLLHSISQGRNSITDVADAKYSKLLPTLKRIYGPDRVAVVVHSFTSFNSNTKMALMMVFKKSQPTTFQCSNCVIQCNNLAEMPAEDLSGLTEFLGKVHDHPLPSTEDELHSTLTTTLSADEIDRIGNDDNPQSLHVFGCVNKGEQIMASSSLSSTDTCSMSQTEIGHLKNVSAISFDSASPVDPPGVGLRSEVALTQPIKSQTSMTSTSSASTADDNLQNIASSTSQLGACSSDTAQVSQTSPKFDTSPSRITTQDKEIDTTSSIALVNLSSADQPEKLKECIQQQLPGKTVMLLKGTNAYKLDWGMFEIILVDLGSSQEAASNSSGVGVSDIHKKCRSEMLVHNLGLLMLAPGNTPIDNQRATGIRHFSKMHKVPLFEYSRELCGPSRFDDYTNDRLGKWLSYSCKRYDERYRDTYHSSQCSIL